MLAPHMIKSGGAAATTTVDVARRIRDDIVAGTLGFGARLTIDALATRYAVSHMPVREALRELQGESVLEVFPHRGAVIKGVDERFVRNFYDIRAAIEGMLTERCAERIDAAGLAQLGRDAAAFEAAARADAAALVRANRALHDTINAGADNPEALRMLAQGRVLADALRMRFGYGHGRIDAVTADHQALLRAIRRRDAAKAGDIARRHCIDARDDLIARMRRSK